MVCIGPGTPQGQGRAAEDRTLGAKPLTYDSVGKPDVMALLLPNNILVLP